MPVPLSPYLCTVLRVLSSTGSLTVSWMLLYNTTLCLYRHLRTIWCCQGPLYSCTVQLFLLVLVLVQHYYQQVIVLLVYPLLQHHDSTVLSCSRFSTTLLIPLQFCCILHSSILIMHCTLLRGQFFLVLISPHCAAQFVFLVAILLESFLMLVLSCFQSHLFALFYSSY